MRLLFIVLFFPLISLAQKVEVYKEGNLVSIENSTKFDVTNKKIVLESDNHRLELSVIRKDSINRWVVRDDKYYFYTVEVREEERGTVVIFKPYAEYKETLKLLIQ